MDVGEGTDEHSGEIIQHVQILQPAEDSQQGETITLNLEDVIFQQGLQGKQNIPGVSISLCKPVIMNCKVVRNLLNFN